MGVVTTNGARADEALRMVGELEHASEHPIAGTTAAAAESRNAALPSVDGFVNRESLGVEGVVEATPLVVGRHALLQDRGMALPDELDDARRAAESRGRTAIAAGWDGAARALFVVGDALKPTSAEAVARLRGLGLPRVLLTGDNEATARAVAGEAIDEVVAEVLPSAKAEVVRRLQSEGRVGDGVDDAPALAQADLGLSIGTGTDAAIQASDLTLVSGDLRAAADTIRLARATLRTITQNLAWALGHDAAAIARAVVALLNPLIAGAEMVFSSVSVVADALRLRRFEAERAGAPAP